MPGQGHEAVLRPGEILHPDLSTPDLGAECLQRRCESGHHSALVLWPADHARVISHRRACQRDLDHGFRFGLDLAEPDRKKGEVVLVLPPALD
jgi:hypothetical protein